MLFEAFNFDYFGPINAHKLNHLIDILCNIRELEEPVLLHVTSVKGKGYTQAEDNPVYFHGVGCFDPDTGNCIGPESRIPSYTQVFGDTLTQLAQKDERIIAVTAAMPEGTGLTHFAKTIPDRFFDVGIAEQHGVTFAAGMATEGFKPVVAIYSTFLQRAYDQIIHDVCIESLPVVFALDRGGIVGEDGPTHHGLFDLSYLRALPNMVVMAPKDENELARMLVTAVHHQGPIALRYPRSIGQGVDLDTDPAPLPLGKAEVLTEGDDLLMVAVGSMVPVALTAAHRLSGEGIQATLVNARFVKPLDADLITELAAQIPRIVTIEENVLQGGFGSAILEALTDAGLGGFKFRRLGIPDQFVEHGPQKLLRHKYGLDVDGVIQAARDMLADA
jgi:1-deoxy-D-xylulose-5-phosphate synthase